MTHRRLAGSHKVKPRGQTAGQDAPDGVSWGYGHKSSDLTQLAALRHLCNRQASPWNVKFLFLFSVLLIG
jgi:hypothetical protein